MSSILDDELRGNKDIWLLMTFKYSLNSVVRSWFFQKFSKVVFLMNHYTLYIYYDVFWNVFWCLRLCSGTGYDCQGNSSFCEGTFLSFKSLFFMYDEIFNWKCLYSFTFFLTFFRVVFSVSNSLLCCFL